MKGRIWGIVLLVLGVLALLQSTGMYNFGLAFWPVVLVLAGAVLVWSSVYHGGCSWFLLGLGLWVGGIGLFSILANAGVSTITGKDFVRLGWPVLLLAAGVSLLFGHRPWWVPRCRYGDHRESHRWCWISAPLHRIGDLYHGREAWVLDGDLDLCHGIGDVVVDLTTARISEGAHFIKIKAGIGEVDIRVPGNVNATVDAAVSIGEVEVFGESRSGFGGVSLHKEVRAADPKVELHIEAQLGIGELAVVRLPACPGTER